MTLYALVRMDKPGMADLRAANQPAHLAFLKEAPLPIRLGGALLDEDDKVTGSLIVVEAESRAEVEAFAAADPYTQLGVYESIRIRRWRIARGSIA